MLFNNQVFLEGYITFKPELKISKNNKNYCRFSVCWNERRKLREKDADGNEYISIPHFFSVIAYSKIAEYISKLDKGTPVTVTGKLIYSEWKDDSGNKKTDVTIYASSVKKLVIEKLSNEQEQSEEESSDTEMFPDEIPFEN